MQHKDTEVIERMAAYCRKYTAENDRLPSVRHLARELCISKSGAQRYLTVIKEQGMIPAVIPTARRGEHSPKLRNNIRCGAPEYQEEDIEEYVFLPDSLYGSGEKFILTASGDSMIGAGIEDGEVLIFRKQIEAEDGDIVAALLNGENTLKRLFYDEDGRPYLHPENEAYEDIRIRDEDDFYIQGVLIYALKRF